MRDRVLSVGLDHYHPLHEPRIRSCISHGQAPWLCTRPWAPMTGSASVASADSDPVRSEIRRDALRARVEAHLHSLGYSITNGRLIAPVAADKDAIRRVHSIAVEDQRSRAAGSLARFEDQFVGRLRAGSDIDLGRVTPRLQLIVDRRSPEGLLWRWIALHWSIPVSAGYGRRLRFLVLDEGHDDAVMGVIGLGDPVFALGCRDEWVGWSFDDRRRRLSSILDAFVLGAVPPYASLLGGKLVALLASSSEVRDAFTEKYDGATSLIAKRRSSSPLAAVTTTSALGRSSIYNRLFHPDGELAFVPVGYTAGSGDFHFSGTIYDELSAFAAEHTPEGVSHRHALWPGASPRNRREVVQRALHELGYASRQMRVHGIRRQVFVAPLMANVGEHLRTGAAPDWRCLEVSALANHWRQRWAEPRSDRRPEWREFEPSSWRLWS